MSSMRDESGDLKSLKENKTAYYIHCFAHQLQLALVVFAKGHVQIALHFNIVVNVFNIVGTSCKRLDQLQDKHSAKVLEALHNSGLPTKQGSNKRSVSSFLVILVGITLWYTYKFDCYIFIYS